MTSMTFRTLTVATAALLGLACTPAATGPATPVPSTSAAPSTAPSAAPSATGSAVPAATPSAAVSPVPANLVAYHGTTQGHLALPAAGPMKAPAVVIIHEWWGLNDHIRGQANELAKNGYVVLAVDLYNGKVAATQAEAQAQTAAVNGNQAEAIANLQDAVKYLRARPEVNTSKVASLGWCFGGGYSLKLVQAQKDLAAGVVYYGALESDAEKLEGLPPMLGIFGKLDTGPSPEQVAGFDAGLTTAGVTHEIYSYDGAGHAFANPSGGDRYKPEAAADAWAKTLAFLNKHLVTR